MAQKLPALGTNRRRIKCFQINLHRAIAASYRLSALVETQCLDFIAVQEPPKATSMESKRNHVKLMRRDLVAIQAEVPSAHGRRKIVLASLYLPGDTEDAVTDELQQLTDYCKRHNLQLVICCDANAHHTGNEPTFMNAIRGEVLDLTLASNFISNSISEWKVLSEITLSDHRYIGFDLRGEPEEVTEIRDVKRTNWSLYNFHLEQGISCLNWGINNSMELDREVNKLNNVIIDSFEKSCPLRTKKRSRNVPWWSGDLDKLRKNVRQLFNRAKSTGDWATYKSALTNYNKELRKSKRESWRKYCESIEVLPTATRIQKSFSKSHTNGLLTLKKADGGFTGSLEETGQLLLDTHFPGSVRCEGEDGTIKATRVLMVTNRNLALARGIFTIEKTKWAISTFAPFKAPGTDDISPCLLQRGGRSGTNFN
ncbi:hypothetical protein EVAR_66464_1 [Eumeta japonica]|uniref:Endonuclease/exonuclease/phosphatase domain-containing protein n=1 Tax=Eumeta variegata TaxID=151549 RepID=A0A4C1SGP9_EUMVA|nr:hypothetical protein EVAR_66464_1 [Eumeta japonica]